MNSELRIIRISALSDRVKAFSCTEDERNTPYTRKGNYRINNSADDSHRTAADPGNDVEIENSDASTVESADNSKNKSYSVYYHHIKKPR